MSPSKTPTRTKYTVFSLVMALIVNGMVVRVLGTRAFEGADLGATLIILVVLNVGMYFFFRRLCEGFGLKDK